MQGTKYKPECKGTSDEVGHIIRHFRNSCMIEVLNILQCSFVCFGNKVNGDSLAAETTTSSNSEIKKDVNDNKNFKF